MGVAAGCCHCCGREEQLRSTPARRPSEPHVKNWPAWRPPTADSTLSDITAVEQASAAALATMVGGSADLLRQIKRHRGGESAEAMYMRFTRARPKSVEAAFNMLEHDLKHRDSLLQTLGGRALGSMTPCEIWSRDTGGDMTQAARVQRLHDTQMPNGFLGYDKQGRPVLYKHYGRIWLNQLLEAGVDVPTMVLYQQWITERCLHAMGHRGQWVVIVDLEGIGFKSCFSSAHLQYCKGLTTLDAAHYPERLGTFVIINVPKVFAGAWQIISSWLDPKTKAKVSLYAAGTWQERVSELIDLSMMPTYLGGTTEVSASSLMPEGATEKAPVCSFAPQATDAHHASPLLSSAGQARGWRCCARRAK